MTNELFQLRTTKRSFSGLNNLLNSEFSRWRTKDWYIMAGIWIAVINLGIFSMTSSAETTVKEGLMMMGLFAAMFPVINVIILLQDEIISHKESGTVSWILSKPVSRSSFILSKLIGNFIGVSISMALFPSILAYIQFIVLKEVFLSPFQYLLGIVLISIYLLFYLTLTLMLGTIFKQRGGVIGIPLVLALGYSFISSFPLVSFIHPMGMFFPTQDGLPMFGSLILGEPIGSISPLIITVVMIVIFTLVALWKFKNEDF
ncbi:MAG: ABC transporter permease [Candidatus Hodarchaeota archaeon]